MALPARPLDRDGRVVTATRLRVGPMALPRWGFATLAGRLVELSAGRAPATLAAALWLVRDAQRLGETTAWVTPAAHCFHPPDAAALGVDLAALVVVRVPGVADVPCAADRLLRSGAFGLVVGDLCAAAPAGPAAIPLPLQSRLVGLAQRHHAVACCLTATPPDAPSLGSLVSLRVTAARSGAGPGPATGGGTASPALVLTITAVKDKRHAPGWSHALPCAAGPAGLR
jgi:recombination protein RecA